MKTLTSLIKTQLLLSSSLNKATTKPSNLWTIQHNKPKGTNFPIRILFQTNSRLKAKHIKAFEKASMLLTILQVMSPAQRLLLRELLVYKTDLKETRIHFSIVQTIIKQKGMVATSIRVRVQMKLSKMKFLCLRLFFPESVMNPN